MLAVSGEAAFSEIEWLLHGDGVMGACDSLRIQLQGLKGEHTSLERIQHLRRPADIGIDLLQ